MSITTPSRSRSERRFAANFGQFACVSALVKGGAALALAAMAAVVGGCGDGEPSESAETDRDGLMPGAGGSGSADVNAAQGGASASNPDPAQGSGGGNASGGTSSSEQPTPVDVSPGAGGAGVDSSGGGGTGAMGMGGSGLGMGGGMNGAGGAEPTDPPAFAPCPADGTPCVIMPLGDSITDGLGSSGGGYRVELFRQAVLDGHEITFVGRQANGPMGAAATIEGRAFPRNHEGYSGATVSTGGNQLANRVDAALAANPPEIILLQIGTNNVYQGMPANLPDQLEALLDQITEGAPDALVVVAQITPLGATFPNNGVEEYNARIPGIVQERVNAGKHLIMVDQFTRIASTPNFVQQLVPDNIHPNNTGYGIMAETWYDAIESFLP